MSNYRETIEHKKLNKVRTITAKTPQELNLKIRAVQKQWDEQWDKKSKAIKNSENKEKKIQLSRDLTKEYEVAIKDIEEMINKEPSYNKPTLLANYFPKKPSFTKKSPQRKVLVARKKPTMDPIPPEPIRSDSVFKMKRSFFHIFPSIRQTEERRMENYFQAAYYEWETTKQAIIENNDRLQQQFKLKELERKTESEKKYETDMLKWEESKVKYEERLSKVSELTKEKKKLLKKADVTTNESYFSHVLNDMVIPIDFNKDFFLKYIPESKQLYVEYNYPNRNDIPSVKKSVYVQSRDEFKETHLSNTALNSLYEKAIYNITMLIVYRLYKHDAYNNIELITLNGFVNTINPATGQEISPCFLSLLVKKEDCENINMNNVNPKEWFKHSKGVSAARITTITPIQPILTINKEDSRFIDSYDVMEGIQIGTNLASMDWQDFENLIRELFEQEFKSNGGEVKITQASKDGGVDAVVFDPDPLRGGKIVVQAKRYTNVVGVSAVRDLYGTVLNEGATKGILVTTSDYGNDSYNFAKDKPLTLLNGSNLLYMLEKHGRKAYIDIAEARKILKESF